MQRRLTLIGIAGIAALLVSCLSRPPPTVASGEVLRRALIRTATLDSVDIDATASLKSVSGISAHASLTLSGTLAPLTHEWIVHVRGNAETPKYPEMRGEVTLASSRPGELYLRIDALRGLGDAAAIMSGSWMMLASGSGTRASPPDPKLLEASASAFSIQRSAMQKEADGTYAYHMSVSVSTGGLLSTGEGKLERLTGDLTIDARSFNIRRADWRLSSVESPLGPIDIELDIRFLRHNAAPISLPILTGSALDIESVFDMISLP